jgi:hypothetical protein
MDGQARNTRWLTPTRLVHPARVSPATDAFSESLSSRLSPLKSPEPWYSSVESETTLSDEPRTTATSASNKSGTLPRHQTQVTSKQGEIPLDKTTVPQKSRRGHKKSHAGCSNCKRRKIKVHIKFKSRFMSNIILVPGNSTGL